MRFSRFLITLFSLMPCCLIAHVLFTPLDVFCQSLHTGKPDNKQFEQQFFRDATDVSFTENKGQWNPAVFYHAGTTRGNVFLTGSGIHYGIRKKIEQKQKSADEELTIAKKETPDHEYMFWNVEFLNASSKAKFEQQKRKGNLQNYYKGKSTRPITNVGSFGEVLRKDIYSQIDVQYHGHEGNLKYDFILKPGSNVSDIRLKYRGIKSLKTNGEGQLVIDTKWGEFLESSPYSYQSIDGTKYEVEVEYKIYRHNEVGFVIKQSYDKQHDLVIDPTLLWSTFLGGVGEDPAYSISTDQNSNVVVTGWTSSVDFPTLNADDNTYSGGDYDAYISKFSPDGALMWSTYLGGSLKDVSYDIECDKNNDIYITGTTNSVDFPASSDAFQTSHRGGDDVFLTKFDNDGILLWSSYYGGSIHEIGENISVDALGNVIMTGYTRSFNFPVTADAYQKTIGGGITQWDVFVAKFNSDGDQIWSTFVGGSDEDFGQGVNVNSQGEIIVSGESKSNDFPTKYAFQSTHQGLYDIILFKLSSDGTALIWSTFIGGTDNSGVELSAEGVGIDSRDNIYIAGFTNSNDFPITLTSPPSLGTYTYLLFCAKFTNSGVREWSTIYGSVQNAYFSSIVVSRCDEVRLSGFTYAESQQPTTSDAFQKSPKGEWYTRESLIVSYSSEGTLQFASYFGGTRDEQAWGITNDVEGNILVCGLTTSPDFPTKNPNQPYYFDLQDGFILKFTPSTNSLTPSFSISGTVCSAEKTFTYTGNSGSSFNWDFGDGTSSAERNPTHLFPAPGNYLVTLTASTGCAQAIIQEEVSIEVVPQASFISTTNCQQESSFVFTGFNATTRLWEFGDGTFSIEVDAAHTYQDVGEYHVKLVVQNGNCADSVTHSVRIKNVPKLELGDPLVICPGEQHVLSARYPEASYSWQDGSIEETFTVSQPGSYWVEVTNACGMIRDEILVSGETLPEIQLGENFSLCEATTVVLNVSFSGATYLWQDGSTQAAFTVTQPGNYWVEATNSCGIERDTIVVSPGTLPGDILGEDLVFCEAASTELNASFPEATYLWHDGSTKATFSVAEPGVFWVKAETKCNEVLDTIAISYKTLPDIELGEDIVVCENVPIVLSAGFPETRYLWQDGSKEATFSVTQSGTYWVEATNVCGTVTDVVKVEVTCVMVIPNVITPNMDGKNDYFVIENLGNGPWELEIFNRWGEPVYSNHTYQNEWNGDDQEDGVYFYHLSGQGNNFKGWVQVLH